MTAATCYRTQYLVNNQYPLFLFSSLGNDVSLRCVIGLPTLISLDGLIDLVKGTFVCSEINPTSPLNLNLPDKGLLDGVVFDNSTLTIPVGLSTNVRSDPTLLHCTSARDRALSSSSTNYSDHIIIHNEFFRENIFRDIKYVPR